MKNVNSFIKDKEVIKYLSRTNSNIVVPYNIVKFFEEKAELEEKIFKWIVKKGTDKAPTNQEIIDEIGDLEIRLKVLKHTFGHLSVNKRKKEKLDKYRSYIKEGKYVGTI